MCMAFFIPYQVCIDQSADSEGDYMSYEAYIRILAKIQAADPANRFKRPDELLHLLKLKARNLRAANERTRPYAALRVITICLL